VLACTSVDASLYRPWQFLFTVGSTMYQESQKENAGKRQTKDQHCAKGGSYTHDALIPWRYVRKMKRTTAVRNEDVNFTLSNKLKDRRIHGIRAWDPRPGVEDLAIVPL
ncbi:MAG: hypothetical protein WBE51_18040, partial [Xanthobacteraceae bacterium]